VRSINPVFGDLHSHRDRNRRLRLRGYPDRTSRSGNRAIYDLRALHHEGTGIATATGRRFNSRTLKFSRHRILYVDFARHGIAHHARRIIPGAMPHA
jgi:hypothetical protein